MIELNSISFSYGEKPIFSGLSASFASGIFYGIIGPNGCGKTTLIRLLCGLERPSAGEVLLNDRPYADYGRKELSKHLSLLPQSRTLPSVSVEELVTRGRYPYLGLTRRLSVIDRRAVAKALNDVGAKEFAHRDVTTLSGGERQNACFAMLLAQDTPYVLLDEPTTYLDIAHRFALLEQLQALRNNGKCVIAVLHDLSLALRYCDRILVLDGGDVRTCDSPEGVISSGIVEDVFGVKCLSVASEGQTDVIFRSMNERKTF